ncbi:hypothetical protein dsx2_2638 [Desulfovibrio sp. X2]|uniref:hypothetical protein n=1 Tax=Desulfovibrio sp. X2 TaxID=941449 RepID=UPI000358BABD|nr:hypothetical protein [Desulfovibrio sp. X2]EPR42721.1 hypothetical protein dsx2_2638 [Desulfovibrio sp. X2]
MADIDTELKIMGEVLGLDVFGGEDEWTGDMDPQEAPHFARYLEDLRAVMSTPEGLRVLWHWRGQATPAPIFVTGAQVYANAALADYARSREAEMSMAAPGLYLKLMAVAAREAAQEAARTLKGRRS